MTHRRRDPVAELLRQRFLTAGHLGLMQPGDRLPGVRQLAAEFDTTQRVIMAALRQLEHQDLVEFRPRSGVYLAARTPPSNVVPDWVSPLARPLLREAIVRGTPVRSIIEHLQLLTSAPARVACVECNDDDSDALCCELQRDFGIASHPIPLDRLRDDRSRRTLKRADAVVTTIYHERPVRAAAAAAGVQFLSVAIRKDLIAEIGNLLGRGTVYFIGTDVRFERKLASVFAGTRSARRLRVCILGRDDVDTIPPAAPVYVMQRAWERLGSWARRDKVHPIQRLIDDASIDPLLELVFVRNLAQAQAKSAAASRPAKRAARRPPPDSTVRGGAKLLT